MNQVYISHFQHISIQNREFQELSGCMWLVATELDSVDLQQVFFTLELLTFWTGTYLVVGGM